MRFKRAFVWLLFVFTGFCSHGQKFQYTHYSSPEVPFENVNQVIRDSLGYIWLATDQGLFRFDGNSFESFNTSLRSKTIRAFIRDSPGSLLFANDTGIYRITYLEGSPSIQAYKTEEGQQYFTGLFKDSQGRIWTSLLDGSVSYFLAESSQPRSFRPTAAAKTPEIFFGEDKFKTVWLLIPGEGLFYFEEQDQKFLPFGNYKIMRHFLITEDFFWMVGERVERLQLSEDKKLISRRIISSDKGFRRIAKKSPQSLMLAKESELYTLDIYSGNFGMNKVFGSNDPHRVEDLPYDTINHLAFTTDEMTFNEVVWVCAENGLGLLWYSFFQTVFGLGYDNVLGLHATENGKVLVSQGSVYEISDRGGFADFKRANDLNGITGIGSGGPYHWFGSTEGKLYQYRNGQILRTYDLSDRGGGIFFFFKDHAGEIWFCQATSDKPIVGAAKISTDGEIVEYGKEKGFEDRVLVVREGGKNELYAAGIGTTSYLYKYDRTRDRFVNKSLPFPFAVSSTFEVHDMAVDRLGIVWLATTDGLLKYDTETIRMVDLGEQTGTEIRSITSMADRSLWLATDTSGLIHLDEKGNYVVFDESSGTPSKVATYRSLTMDSDSRVWVGTAEGLVYSLQSLPGPLATKAPVWRSAQHGAEKLDLQNGIVVSGSGELRITVTTITFPGTDVRYQYKVFPAKLPEDEIPDIPWTASEKSELVVKDLEAGSFKVWVRAQKNGGFAWSKPLEIPIEVTQKWYRSWWGISLLAIAGFLFFWYFVRRWFQRRIGTLQAAINQKQEELSKREAEIISQSTILKDQQKELKNTGTNIFLLHRLIRQIPKEADWKGMGSVLQRLVDLPTGIDLVELAYKSGEQIRYLGYARGGKEVQRRQEEFNEKENLASYAIVTAKTITISDFDKEASQFIAGKDSKGYKSRLLIPFQQQKAASGVVCVYAKQEGAFAKQEVMLLQILVAFMAASTKNDLK